MSKYRKKPVEIEAVKVPLNEYADSPLGDWEETPDWLQHAFDTGTICPRFAGEDYWYYDIATLEGVMTASPGDFIILGVEGELYPCKPSVFAATYEAVATIPYETDEGVVVAVDLDGTIHRMKPQEVDQ